MTYCVYITRRARSEGPADPPITLEEWASIVDTDPELSPCTDYESVPWRGVCSQPDPTFEWHQGEIIAHNPDPAQLTKLRELALRLAARAVTEDEIDVTDGYEDEEFDPTTAYDYDFAEARRRIDAYVYRGIKGFCLRHMPLWGPLAGFAIVILAAILREWHWHDYVIAFLAGGVFTLHFYYRDQQRRIDEFQNWLLRNVPGLAQGTMVYRGIPVTLETCVTRYSGAYSLVISHSDWSRWYFIGIDDWRGRWFNTIVTVVFGSWGLPLGPIETLLSLWVNLPAPGGDVSTVRNLCLSLDDRLCKILGPMDPEPIRPFKQAQGG